MGFTWILIESKFTNQNCPTFWNGLYLAYYVISDFLVSILSLVNKSFIFNLKSQQCIYYLFIYIYLYILEPLIQLGQTCGLCWAASLCFADLKLASKNPPKPTLMDIKEPPRELDSVCSKLWSRPLYWYTCNNNSCIYQYLIQYTYSLANGRFINIFQNIKD